MGIGIAGIVFIASLFVVVLLVFPEPTFQQDTSKVEPLTNNTTITVTQKPSPNIQDQKINDFENLNLKKEGEYRFFVEEIPDYADKNKTRNAIEQALLVWSEENKNLEFKEVEKFPYEFRITWGKDLGEIHQGFIDGKVITIGMGRPNQCTGEWMPFDDDRLTYIVAHEVGHALGLGHHPDENHLMFGEDDLPVDGNFDTNGYNVPELDNGFYEGYGSLEKRYYTLYERVESIKSEIEQLESEYDAKLKVYEQYPEVINDALAYQEAMRLHDELERLYSKIENKIHQGNTLSDQLNELASQANCYPEITDPHS